MLPPEAEEIVDRVRLGPKGGTRELLLPKLRSLELAVEAEKREPAAGELAAVGDSEPGDETPKPEDDEEDICFFGRRRSSFGSLSGRLGGAILGDRLPVEVPGEAGEPSILGLALAPTVRRF